VHVELAVDARRIRIRTPHVPARIPRVVRERHHAAQRTVAAKLDLHRLAALAARCEQQCAEQRAPERRGRGRGGAVPARRLGDELRAHDRAHGDPAVAGQRPHQPIGCAEGVRRHRQNFENISARPT
jgi:hypothetical protein